MSSTPAPLDVLRTFHTPEAASAFLAKFQGDLIADYLDIEPLNGEHAVVLDREWSLVARQGALR